MSDKQSRRARRLRSRFVQLGFLVIVYYLVPIRELTSVAEQIIRAVAALLVIVAIVYWITREVVRQTSHSPAEVNQDRLLLLVGVGLTLFALADLVVARSTPLQFVGLQTKTDALYFALTTLTTVGFGDVHAEGQIARGLVILQMVFNVVVLTQAAQIMLASRSARRSPDKDA